MVKLKSRQFILFIEIVFQKNNRKFDLFLKFFFFRTVLTIRSTDISSSYYFAGPVCLCVLQLRHYLLLYNI